MPLRKKAKKSNKKAQKSDWTQDGGTSVVNDVGKERTGLRKTQDRDERFRRGRLKMAIRKNDRLFANKMTQKVSFAALLPTQEHIEGADDENTVSETRNVQVRRKSSLSVFQRLQSFLRSSSRDEKSEEEQEVVEDLEVQSHSNATITKILENMDAEISEAAAERMEEGLEVLDHDDDEGIEKNCSAYEWFFSPGASGCILPKQQLVGECEGFTLVKSSNPGGAFKNNHWKSLGDIPGLPNLWRSRASMAFNPVSSLLLPQLSTYCDALLDGRDHRCDKEFTRIILQHAAIHVFRARSRVQKHNTKLKKKLAEALADSEKQKRKSSRSDHLGNDLPDAYQDQGFSRPRVLILCPFRGTALTCVETILEIYGEKTSVANYDKFLEEYGPPDFDDEAGSEDDMPSEDNGSAKSKPERKRTKLSNKKTDDWAADFRQNVDDDFKIGLQINPGHGKGSGADKGVYMRLYSDFFISDIIVASPLGLRFIIENASNGSADFLSSIEIAILHQADVMYMQNWDHVDYVLRHTNKLPSSNNEIDFSRVRPYFLDGLANTRRQTIITTQFNEPQIQASFREFGRSIAGTIRLTKTRGNGTISNVMRSLNQVFQRVQSNDFSKLEDDRFSYFKESVLGPLLRTNQKRTIIFVPSYISYVRVRNELMRQEASAAFICEYSRESEISRGRSRFFHGSKDILLYSGRFHYFRRYSMRGANHIIFYSLPEHPQFYPEMVNLITEATDAASPSSCLVLFTKFEKMALSRIVGEKWAKHLLTNTKETFLFK